VDSVVDDEAGEREGVDDEVGKDGKGETGEGKVMYWLALADGVAVLYSVLQ